jgi:hypothetical protein
MDAERRVVAARARARFPLYAPGCAANIADVYLTDARPAEYTHALDHEPGTWRHTWRRRWVTHPELVACLESLVPESVGGPRGGFYLYWHWAVGSNAVPSFRLMPGSCPVMHTKPLASCSRRTRASWGRASRHASTVADLAMQPSCLTTSRKRSVGHALAARRPVEDTTSRACTRRGSRVQRCRVRSRRSRYRAWGRRDLEHTPF